MTMSQKYMDEIAQKSCSCVNEVQEGEDRSKMQMRLGLCIIQAAEPFSKELRKDHQIDFNRIDVDGEKLGKLIGIKMVSICPEVFENMNIEEEDSEVFDLKGVVTEIVQDGFVYFIINNQDGRTSKYYWLTYVDSELDIENNFESLKGKSVLVKYMILEIFDPKINDYRNINVLISLNL